MKNKSISQRNRGFTLIELLVVVAIISLLSSVIFASLNSARAKAMDAQRKIEFNQLSKAMALYFDKYGSYPNNSGYTGAYPGQNNFNTMATLLVSEKFLSKVPVSPCGTTCGYSAGGYEYYNYSSGTYDGAFAITSILTGPLTTTGIPPSCRQSIASNAYCYNNSTKTYCMCFPNK